MKLFRRDAPAAPPPPEPSTPPDPLAMLDDALGCSLADAARLVEAKVKSGLPPDLQASYGSAFEAAIDSARAEVELG